MSLPSPPDPEARLRLLRLPGLRGALRMFCPPSVDSFLERVDVDAPDAEERIPYWAELWPSAEALARWLSAGGGPRRPGAALEIGCGLGLVGLTALRLGWDSILSDKDPDACRWAARNLALNGFDPARVLRLDWREAPPRRFDTLLASDVLYERAFADDLIRFLDRALAAEGRAFLAEPGRPIADSAIDALGEAFRLNIHPARARAGSGRRAVRILKIRRRTSR